MRKLIEQKRQLKFDQLNQLVDGWTETGEDPKAREKAYKKAKELFEDCLIGFLVDGYTLGLISLNIDKEMPDPYMFLNIEYDGVTIEEKFRKYWETGDYESIKRLAESEANRMWNQGSLLTGAKYKTWHTQMDERVRDEHWPLEGITVPIDGVFVTYTGDEGQGPGMFSQAYNNANCRCYLTVSNSK